MAVDKTKSKLQSIMSGGGSVHYRLKDRLLTVTEKKLLMAALRVLLERSSAR